MKKRYYGVRIGRKNQVIVTTWDECSKLVTGFQGARFKGFAFRDEAEKFINDVDPVVKPKATTPKRKDFRDVSHWHCIERKSYRHPFTGIYYKNACVMRQGPTMTGENFVPSNDTSVPWE